MKGDLQSVPPAIGTTNDVTVRSISEAPVLSVVIISYNTREMTLRCLACLHEELGSLHAEVLVVDNASTDGSAAAIRKKFGSVKVTESERNNGFGAANNVAMHLSHGRYLLLLNSDAFLNRGALEAMVSYLDSHPECGVVGPRLLNEDGSLQRSCFRFPTPLQAWLENLWVPRVFPDHPVFGDFRSWKHDSEREVDFVVGACLMIRREVVELVGGFDERFFMYQEEADWQRRIQCAGWKVAFTPRGTVTHLGGASGGNPVEQINEHFFESLDKYEIKHHGTMGFILTRLAMLVGCSLRAGLWSVACTIPGRWQQASGKVRKHLLLLRRQLLTPKPSS